MQCYLCSRRSALNAVAMCLHDLGAVSRGAAADANFAEASSVFPSECVSTCHCSTRCMRGLRLEPAEHRRDRQNQRDAMPLARFHADARAPKRDGSYVDLVPHSPVARIPAKLGSVGGRSGRILYLMKGAVCFLFLFCLEVRRGKEEGSDNKMSLFSELMHQMHLSTQKSGWGVTSRKSFASPQFVSCLLISFKSPS